MTPMTVLEDLKTFIEARVASQVQLIKDPEADDVSLPFELVNPIVAIQYLPPRTEDGLWTPQQNYIVPSITIMTDKGSDNDDGATQGIRIVFAVFSPGIKNAEGVFIPDNQGYRDLLNLIERTRQELFKAVVIEGAGTATKPFEWDVYSIENTYPRHFGEATFSMSVPSIEPIIPTL